MLKELNERTVFTAIRSGHPISRAEISRRVGISKPTVSLALRTLLDAGLVRETSPGLLEPTYGAVFFEPVPEAGYVLAFDIGARFLRCTLAALDGRVRAREDVDTAGADASRIVAAAAACGQRLLAAGGTTGQAEIAVVGAPGVVDPTTGRVWQVGSVPGLEGFDLVGEFGRALGTRVIVDNDVNLAALGEQWKGVGRGVADFAFLSVGTGVGAGLVLRGEPHRGHAGAAGEVDNAFDGAWPPPERANRPRPAADPCAPALLEHARARLAERTAVTSLAEPLTPERVFAAARAGDALAEEIVAEEARRIARYAGVLASVLDVELVVLGGGVGCNGDLLLEPVRAALAERVPYPPRLAVSALGADCVLTGALAVGTREALDQVLARTLARRAG
jgi:predicted NBD/HSP70 family sugar kinase